MLLPPRNWSEAEDWLDEHMTVAFRFHVGRGGDAATRAIDQLESLDDAAHTLTKAFSPAAAEISKCVQSLANGESLDWPNLSPLAGQAMLLRLQTIYNWMRQLRTHALENHPVAPMPFPDVPWDSFVQWLLVEWWEEHGNQLAADEAALVRVWHS